MWRQIIIVAALLGIGVIAAAVVQKNSAPVYKTPRAAQPTVISPIEALNACIQERFHSITGVGMSRMPVSPLHMRNFRPETKAEKAAVAELQKSGWIVGMYLGGRRLLKPKISEAQWRKTSRHHFRRAISAPLLITQNASVSKLPPSWELWDDGQKALVTSASSDKHTSSRGAWRVDARPVRADKESCLKCHAGQSAVHPAALNAKAARPMRVGDAVGVVIYVYRRATPADAQPARQTTIQTSRR